jgi:putative membrane protein
MTIVLASIFAVLAAGIHVVIFLLESVLWSRPSVWRRFGLRAQSDADTVGPMALNQGFYNLFLAGGVVAGLLLAASGWDWMSAALLLFALACMLLASLVLVASSPRLWRAAIVQGGAPLVALVLLIVALGIR